MAQTVKRPSTMRETRVRALGWEDPLEKEMAIHSSTIAWKIPWTEEPGRLQSMGSQRVGNSINTITFSHSVQLLGHVRLFATPWTVAHQAPLSMGIFKQEY